MGKDPRIIEIILNETNRIVKMKGRHLIVEHEYGHICANAGIDRSNVKSNRIVLLPRNSDKSANQIRKSIKKVNNNDVAIIITDTCGRPFRKGQVNIAIGISGLKPIKNYIGIRDRYNQRLRSTMIAVADELASAAELVMGKIDNIPIAIIKGYQYSSSNETAKELIRDSNIDLFA
jgi:coenzyme F420-0:L-glutamate ligase/coenzyme F420-1:gamma-L-glutamate ligase